MLEARRAAAADSSIASGTVIRAGYQTSGRGRLADRRWETEAGDGLLFTVIFAKPDLDARLKGKPFTLLPLLCGLAVARAVEDYLNEAAVSEIRIKWPNDVLAGGKKICGILCEAAGDFIYAGMGLNLNQTVFPDGYRRLAASVRMLTGSTADGNELLLRILGRLSSVLGSRSWQADINSRLYGISSPVKILAGLAEESGNFDVIEGILSGVSDVGAVLIDSGDKIVPVYSGELKV